MNLVLHSTKDENLHFHGRFESSRIWPNSRECGYAALWAGLMSFLEPLEWAAAEYRMLLFITGGSANRSDKDVLDPEVIQAELARGGKWDWARCCACRRFI